EEEILFPELKPIVGEESGPVVCMLDEHRHEKELLDVLRKNVAEKPSEETKKAITNAGYAIIDLLTKHIWKEDNVLFPMAESVLSAETKEKVAKGFNAIGNCCCECAGHSK
ncbi:hemerythrin domain-containing protein, partial [Candidatus Peregrinibacteria bacterium]|nr:hemerythrin domain-containing protein [Candidatus Peregrinibacteria bacterium]